MKMPLHEMLFFILCGVLVGVLIIACTISCAIYLGRGYARPKKNTLVDSDSSLEDK